MSDITIRNVTKAFGKKHVLQGLNLEVKGGQTVLITGDNGTGKTTLFEILSGQLIADTGVIFFDEDKEVDLAGSNLFGLWERIYKRQKMGQKTCTQTAGLYNSLSLEDNARLADPYLTAHLNLDRKPESLEYSRNLEFVEKFVGKPRMPSSLSFGEYRSFAIERQTAFSPAFCLLDEPCAGLDASNIEKLRSQLVELKKNNSATIIIEHHSNIHKVADLIDKVYELNKGILKEDTKTLVNSAHRMEVTNEQHSVSSFYPHSDSTREMPLHFLAGVTQSVRTEEVNSPLIFGDLIANPIEISKPGILKFRAPNGWGKSTFCSELLGIKSGFPVSIILELNGKNLSNGSPSQIRENGLTLFRTQTAFPNTILVRSLFNATGTKPSERSRKFLNRKLGTLSGGERKFVLLDIFLSQSDAKYFILDEPYQGLDRIARQEIKARISELAKHCILMVFEPS